MSHILTTRERRVLSKFDENGQKWAPSLKFPGMGKTTMKALLDLGLIETKLGASGYDVFKIHPDASICMYGKPHDVMLNSGEPHLPLKVWRWPLAE